MAEWTARVDELLRGGYTQRELLREGRVSVPSRTLLSAALALGVVYGLCMGLFALVDGRQSAWQQVGASAFKVPLLFLLTLIVTFPSLYVFSALANSRLRLAETLRLLFATVCVNLAVLASLGPITAFFTLSTKNYAFIQVLNAMFFAVAGLTALGFLRRAVAVVHEPREGEAKGERKGRRVFFLWMLLYGVVGAQMGWILRPFIGAPGLPFELFRDRRSNILAGLAEALRWALF